MFPSLCMDGRSRPKLSARTGLFYNHLQIFALLQYSPWAVPFHNGSCHHYFWYTGSIHVHNSKTMSDSSVIFLPRQKYIAMLDSVTGAVKLPITNELQFLFCYKYMYSTAHDLAMLHPQLGEECGVEFHSTPSCCHAEVCWEKWTYFFTERQQPLKRIAAGLGEFPAGTRCL